jgi:hypothetical protein
MDAALRLGLRGLPYRSSLARLLAERRGKRNPSALPPFTVPQILSWVDAYYRATGTWPSPHSGPIADAPGETWSAVQAALAIGVRGLAGGSSLPRLLAQHRGVRNPGDLPDLTEEQILAWADAHHQRLGTWPTARSGPVVAAPGETWGAIDVALNGGGRGLPGGFSLPRLLARDRGARNHLDLPALTEEQILAWADAHHQRTGQWPTKSSGPIGDDSGTTWMGAHIALNKGRRGLPGGSSLARILERHRGVRNLGALPALTEAEVLGWADAHYQRTGQWPITSSGPVVGVAGETWASINSALETGRRGVPGGYMVTAEADKRRRRFSMGAEERRPLPKGSKSLGGSGWCSLPGPCWRSVTHWGRTPRLAPLPHRGRSPAAAFGAPAHSPGRWPPRPARATAATPGPRNACPVGAG